MLCQLSDVKSYLGITSANTDTLLTTLITNASAYIERYCNRVFAESTYTETRNGNGADAIYLRATPIMSVQSVTVDGNTIPAAPDSVSYGYVFDNHKVYIRGYARVNPITPGIFAGWPGNFSRGIQNIVIGYTAGFTSVPPEISQTCVELVAWKFGKRDRLDKKNEVLAGQTVNYDTSDMPASVKSALSDWIVPMVPP